MAVCEIWDVRGRLDHPIDYAENPAKTANPKYTEADLQAMVDVMEYATNKNKTEQRFFVTGVNCDPTTARDEMMITKAGWSDTSEIVCYHGFQSFKHGEVTPEQAHEVGVKLSHQRIESDDFTFAISYNLHIGISIKEKMRHQGLSEDKRCHFRIWLIVNQSIQRMLDCLFLLPESVYL